MTERLEPQRRQTVLGRPEEADVDEVGGERRHDDADERDPDVARDDRHVGAAGGEDAVVGDALDDEGHQHPAEGRQHGEQHRDPDALAQLG